MNPSANNPLSQNPQPKKRVVQPLPGQTGRDDPASPTSQTGSNPAVDLIRNKISALYQDEPSAKEELIEAKAVVKHRSKHQQFMYELSESGKPLAEIQAAWHQYYVDLPDREKHQVWQEFYAEHSKVDKGIKQARSESTGKQTGQVHPPQQSAPVQPHPVATPKPRKNNRAPDLRSVSDIKQQIFGKVRAQSKPKSPHIQSLLFGLGMGGIVVFLLLFSFFNERIVAPFITPSRTVSSTPIITDPASTPVGKESKVIIPKINVEIPVVYDEPSIQEGAVQKALERGVLHYATTPSPGEKGNAVIFGHSSNNILNSGKYKFAFVLLSRLENGDTFMLEKGGKRFVYKVFEKKIVAPTDLSVLEKTGKVATATLITCDPPGTSINRLVVIGEQISPSATGNVASSVKQKTAVADTSVLPSNSPSLWSRITGVFGS